MLELTVRITAPLDTPLSTHELDKLKRRVLRGLRAGLAGVDTNVDVGESIEELELKVGRCTVRQPPAPAAE